MAFAGTSALALYTLQMAPVFFKSLFFSFALATLSCATTRMAQPIAPQGSIASTSSNEEDLANGEGEGVSTAQAEDDDGSSVASRLLDAAFLALHEGQIEASLASFRGALASGQLNDAGRALCYWHIYDCEASLHRDDSSRDALADFLVVAEEINRVGNGPKGPAQAASHDFMARFDLKSRLIRGRATMSLAWSHHVDGFGRSAQLPVPVYSRGEISTFLAMAAPCGDAAAAAPGRVTQRRRQIMSTNGRKISRVDVSCHGATKEHTSFYFENLAEAQEPSQAQSDSIGLGE